MGTGEPASEEALAGVGITGEKVQGMVGGNVKRNTQTFTQQQTEVGEE